jgi:hypothetical protein
MGTKLIGDTMSKKIIITGGWRPQAIPVLDGDNLNKLSTEVEAFVFVPTHAEHDPMKEMDNLVKRSRTAAHKELMRKGRREFHKK